MGGSTLKEGKYKNKIKKKFNSEQQLAVLF
jgi:hypothetical protein